MIDELTVRLVAVRPDCTRVIVATAMPESLALEISTRLSRMDLISEFVIEAEGDEPAKQAS